MHVCNTHKANAMIKQNRNKRTTEMKKNNSNAHAHMRTCAHTHTHGQLYIYMQKCRSCHQNNTNSSINMIIVAFYYDFSDTILTARLPHCKHLYCTKSGQRHRVVLSTTFAHFIALRSVAINVSNTHRTFFSFLYNITH